MKFLAAAVVFWAATDVARYAAMGVCRFAVDGAKTVAVPQPWFALAVLLWGAWLTGRILRTEKM